MNNKGSILIVDDDENLRETLSLMLEMKGYATDSASSGSEAIDKVQGRLFNIALLDIKLPDIDGIDLLRSLKEKHPDLAAIMVTAHSSTETAVQALNRGASAYITKPIGMNDIISVVQDTLEKQRLLIENRRLFQEAQQELAERKRAEAQLRTQKEFTDRILETTPSAVMVINSDLHVVMINQRFCITFGREKSDVEGKQLGDIMPVKNLSDRILKTFAGEEPQALEVFRYETPSGTGILEANIVPMGKDEILLIINDVTEVREKQEKLYLTDRLASVGEMAAGIAHELNNPLTSAIGFSELLMQRDLPEDIKEDLGLVYSEAKRAASTVKNLLAFAREHSQKKEMVQINKVVLDVLKLRAYDHRIHNIQVMTKFDEQLPDILADYFQMQQVFLNIIINAEHAMIEAHNKGILTISTEKKNNIVKISFTDDGPGISAEIKKRIFDPFFTTKGVGNGTGLGLSICFGIVSEHGGKTYCESELGQGTTFIVELPISH